MTYIEGIVICIGFVPLAFPSGLSSVLDSLNNIVYVNLRVLVNVLPYELICVRCCSSITASSTNEYLAIVLRCSGDFARWIFGLECGCGDN